MQREPQPATYVFSQHKYLVTTVTTQESARGNQTQLRVTLN